MNSPIGVSPRLTQPHELYFSDPDCFLQLEQPLSTTSTASSDSDGSRFLSPFNIKFLRTALTGYKPEFSPFQPFKVVEVTSGRTAERKSRSRDSVVARCYPSKHPSVELVTMCASSGRSHSAIPDQLFHNFAASKFVARRS